VESSVKFGDMVGSVVLGAISVAMQLLLGVVDDLAVELLEDAQVLGDNDLIKSI
jgi:hypothetical protein